jgi:hypothetical protein
MKKAFLFIILFSLSFVSCDKEGFNWLTNDKNVSGLKEALKVGVRNGTAILGQENGFLSDPTVFIDLPAENKATIETATKVIGAINSIPGVKSLVQAADINVSIFDANFATNLINAFNRGASKAVADPRTVDVFVSAITNMTMTDAKDILFTSNNEAATDYLQTTTSASLATQFSPIINETIQEINVTAGGTSYSALDAWRVYAQANDKLITFIGTSEVQTALTVASFLFPNEVATIKSIQPAAPDLGTYVVGRALDGVFTKIGIEETKIRTDVNARTNKLLQDVFGQLDR